MADAVLSTRGRFRQPSGFLLCLDYRKDNPAGCCGGKFNFTRTINSKESRVAPSFLPFQTDSQTHLHLWTRNRTMTIRSKHIRKICDSKGETETLNEEFLGIYKALYSLLSFSSRNTRTSTSRSSRSTSRIW